MGKFSKFYTTVAINIVNVLVLLLVIELGTRALLEHITPIDINAQTLVTDKGQEPFFQSNPFAAFAWIPGARFGRQTVNSEGFVSTREIAFPRQANELRVVTLGGSSTVGNGNTDETTYPRLLEAKLQQAYPDRVVNVINAAAGGYSTIESLGYLQSRMIHWQPDVVVIMHGWNDMYYFALSDQEISKWRDNFNLQAMWNPKAALKMDDPMPADVQYLSWSQFYLHLREWVRSTAYDGESNPQEVIEGRYQFARLNDDGTMSVALQPINANAERLYETNMAQFRSICAKREIRCLSVLQASLLSDKANPDDPKVRQGAKTAVLYHGFDQAQHIAAFNRLYETNRRVWGEEAVVDATDLAYNSAHFFDHIHLSPRGNEALATLVAEKLIQGSGSTQDEASNN